MIEMVETKPASPAELAVAALALSDPTDAPAPVAPAIPSPKAPPAPAEPARVRPAMGVLPLVAVGLSLFASVVSVTSLVIMGRSVGQASALAMDARERAQALGQVPALVAALKELRTKEEAAVARIDAVRTSQPVSLPDARRLVDDLRVDLQRHDPQLAQFEALRDGQSELAERITAVGIKVERVEDQLRTSRRAPREAGRAPIS